MMTAAAWVANAAAYQRNTGSRTAHPAVAASPPRARRAAP